MGPAMRWKELLRLVRAAPEDHWDADLLFVLLGVLLAVWVGSAHDSAILGLGVAALVWAVREVLFHLFVRRRSKNDS